jgi:uncharacterized oligopeptide transporter (OPT) family protein
MLRLLDLLYRCFYNLVSKKQPSYMRAISAHVGLWVFFSFSVIGCYSLLRKLIGSSYLPPISGFVYAGLCVIAACISLSYYTRHPPTYWESYQGDNGNVRVSYALLCVVFFVLLGFLCARL